MSEVVYAIVVRDSGIKVVSVHCYHVQGLATGRWPAGRLADYQPISWGVCSLADRRYRSATLDRFMGCRSSYTPSKHPGCDTNLPFTIYESPEGVD